MTLARARPAPSAGDPAARLAALCDDGRIAPLGGPAGAGARAVSGRIAGVPAVAFATDPTTAGGALDEDGCTRIADAVTHAAEAGVPCVGLWHSGGAHLAGGVRSLDGVGRIFAAMVRASGRIPQISVVLGPAAGGAAYGPALTDVVVLGPAARVFVTGPDVVRRVTGEDVDAEGLGGPDVHAHLSGLADVVAGDERSAVEAARRVVAVTAPGPARPAGAPDPSAALPGDARRAYDVRPVLTGLLDRAEDPGDALLELRRRWAPNIVTGFGRVGGRAVGVVANNPLRLGGCLDAEAAEKAARFVRMCDAWGLPLLVAVDVPGFLPGAAHERGGIVRRGAKLLHAFAEATVPRVTLILRKAFGGAYVAMNSRALGADAVLAWPGADISVMGPGAAAEILHRRELSAAAPHRRAEVLERRTAELHAATGGAGHAHAAGMVDEIVRPVETRERLLALLAGAPARRGRHGNIPL